jgi:hypothetical protein
LATKPSNFRWKVIIYVSVPGESCTLLCAWRASCRAHLSSGFGDEVEGNRHMWRILNQCANTAVKAKESIFEIGYQR